MIALPPQPDLDLAPKNLTKHDCHGANEVGC